MRRAPQQTTREYTYTVQSPFLTDLLPEWYAIPAIRIYYEAWEFDSYTAAWKVTFSFERNNSCVEALCDIHYLTVLHRSRDTLLSNSSQRSPTVTTTCQQIWPRNNPVIV